ncbi:MAG: hypothetical protein UR98_C0040G0002 [Parcubacteria group bacterium GW2011_GWA1_36_12]|nr:MAG: hypothetical protein UR98_C0040G0002 [Parcubacteria group bacterium GW2011_GWA1_36_12]
MEDTINLKEEVFRLGRVTGFPIGLLEKDYHLTKILHKISEKKIEHLVFKGGTCLNKCYLGFYRLSEDLDFVFNQDVKGMSKMQIKRILDEIRRKMFEILDGLNLETIKEIGKGWKMLTSKEIDNSTQKIKIDVSFRKKLINPTKIRPIHHEFIDSLGEPILKEDVKIESIDLSENFAEKFRALVTRKNIAVRDIYDIHFILKENILKIDEEIIALILIKIKESSKSEFTRDDLRNFIISLDSKMSNLNEKEISAVLTSGKEVNVREMVRLIKHEVLKTISPL